MKNAVLSLLWVVALVTFSCKSEIGKKNDTITNKEKYNNPKDKIIVFDTVGEVPVVYKDSILDWKGYFRVKKTLKKLRKTSVTNVLSSSTVLVKNVKVMKDSISTSLAQNRGIRARINGLYNQSLRLQDMRDIPAITVDEVTKQTQGLFVIFRTIDKKINAIYDQVEFEREMKDDNFFFSKIDSIR
ncbi:hypothetical protein ACXGQW_03475 [Wenyingzhuangia sp. IMCC45533]